MIAYVLSGGNLRGALQVGALQTLLADPACRPDLIVGTSIGAFNGALIAVDPTPAGTEHLAGLWRNVKRKDVYPGNRLSSVWQLIRRKDSLFPNAPLRGWFQHAFPPGFATFGDLKLPLYVTGSTLNSDALYVWGDEPDTSLIDALLVTVSLPGTFPPVEHAGYQYVDGGLVANIAPGVAVDRGATEIYVLDVAYLRGLLPPAPGLRPIPQHALPIMLHQQSAHALRRIAQLPGVTLHHIRLDGYKGLAHDDFSQADAMLADGRRQMDAYLSNPTPNVVHDELAPPPPPGSVRFVPGFRSDST